MQRFRQLILHTCLAWSFAVAAQAGLISVNFTNTSPTAPAFDGTGVLGGGVWNRIRIVDIDEVIALDDSSADETGVSIDGIRSGEVGAVLGRTTAANINNVQSQGWIVAVEDAIMILTIQGLLANQVYELVIYSDRVGTGEESDVYQVNGTNLELANPGAADTELPGVENADYVTFFPVADADGEITILGSSIAGLQIQGRLTSGESGSRVDAVISTIPGITTGKGENIFKPGRHKKQILSTKSKRRGVTFYPVLQNDGPQVDYVFLKASYSQGKSKVLIRDSVNNGNVTAAARSGSYRFVLDNGDARPFSMSVKPLNERTRKIGVRVCGMPSTRAHSLTDCVVGELTQKQKKKKGRR